MIKKDPHLEDLIDFVSTHKQKKRTPKGLRGSYLRLTEETNALDYLQKTYDYICKVDADVFAWKWVIIALHGALYGFAICACAGSNPDYVAPVTKKGKNKGERHLISLNKALELCQNPRWMRMFVHSKYLQLSEQQKESIKWLKDEFRNEFEHFSPKGWSIELHGMPQIIIDVLDVVRFLALDTGNFFFTPSQRKKVKSIIFQSKRILMQSKLYKETEELDQRSNM